MTTAPFLPDTESVIRKSHQQVIRASATHPDLAGSLELDIEDISLDWDEQRSPRASATLTVRIPDSLTDVAILDPRIGVRISIEAGYVRPGGEEDSYEIANLGLRDVEVNRPENTMTLDCASDEMLCIDASPSVASTVTGTSHADAITKLIKQCISPAPRITATVTGPAVTLDPVEDRWDSITDVADRIGATVYDDGLRNFYIAAVPVTAGTPDATLKVGSAGTVLRANTKLSRDDWFNYVYLKYVWRDAAGNDKFINATAYVKTGDYAISGPSGKRIFELERNVQTTQAEANASAKEILKRFLARTRSYSLTSIAAYWLRPGMTVAIQLPDQTEPSYELVQRVRFNPLAGTMDVQTRDYTSDADIDTTTPPPVIPTDPSPTPTPDPEPPAKQTYVSEWVASSSQAYQADGDKRTDIPTEFAQGYFSSFNGNQRSILLFTGANSTGDETGKTITQALTGATLIKAEVIAYANHWYYTDGGIARIGYYHGTSMPATFSGGLPYVTVTGWKRNTTRTVNVSNKNFFGDLLDGSARGILFGPGSGTDKHYYGVFNGATASSNKPRLRLTYSK